MRDTKARTCFNAASAGIAPYGSQDTLSPDNLQLHVDHLQVHFDYLQVLFDHLQVHFDYVLFDHLQGPGQKPAD